MGWVGTGPAVPAELVRFSPLQCSMYLDANLALKAVHGDPFEKRGHGVWSDYPYRLKRPGLATRMHALSSGPALTKQIGAAAALLKTVCDFS